MTEENNLDALITELKNVTENPEDLTYGDLMKEVSVAYRAAGIAATENKVEAAEEIKGYLSKLNDLAGYKKEKKVKPTSLKDMKAAAKAEVVPEVKSANSIMDVPPTVEVGSYEKEPVFEDEITKDTERDIPVEVEEKNIRAPVVEEEKKPVKSKVEKPLPKQIPIPAPESQVEKPKIEIEVPDNDSENIIVQSTTEDKSEESKENTQEKKNDLYSDLEAIFTPKPFDGDDDDTISLETTKSEETSHKQKLEVQTKEEVEAERIKQIDEEYGNLPEDVHLMNVKSISRKKISDTIKALSGLDTSDLDVQKLEMFDFNVDDQSIRRDYLKTRNDMISAPKISRIALLMSGHYQEISAYGNYDLISVERNIYSQQNGFADKERLLLESIYSHVNYVSYSKEKPDFDTWAKNIYYPDLQSLYFGVYDANSVGANHYLFDCPYCGEEVNINRKNADLTVGVPKELSKNELESFITNKDIMVIDASKLSKWAKTTVVRKLLPNSKIIVDFAVPSIYDYLTTLYTLEKINHRDLGGRLDLSIIDGFNATTEDEQDQQIEHFNRIMACIYIKQIGIPTRVEGGGKFRYIKITNKADIIEHVNGFDEDDYSELLRGKEVRDLITKTATRYYLQDCMCSSCSHNIKYVSINPKQIFFFKIGEGRNKRMMG